MERYTVIIDAWEIECCGTPFKVSDSIEWRVSKWEFEKFNKLLVDVGNIDFYYDHHCCDDNTKLFKIRGNVVSILAIYRAYKRKSENSDLMIPISEIAVEINEAKRWDKGFEGKELSCYFVCLENVNLSQINRKQEQLLYDALNSPDYADFAKFWNKYTENDQSFEIDNSEKDTDFYNELAKPALKKSDIHKEINHLKKAGLFGPRIGLILNAYSSLWNLTKEMDSELKLSLCSKYLHFHFPKLFFIYDSRAKKAIEAKNIISECINYEISIGHTRRTCIKVMEKYKDRPESEYVDFFCKCFLYRIVLFSICRKWFTPREIYEILTE